MTATAEVIQMEDQIIIKEFGIQELTAANIALMEKQILEIPETPEAKEQYDKAYRFHVDSKNLLPRIEERRKELKAPVLQKGKDIDATTKKAVAMVNPLIELAGSRRAAWEEIKEAEKAEKEEAERLRLGKIQWRMDGLECDCAKGLEYNLCVEEIMAALTWLKEIEISAVDYEERTEEAEHRLASAIISTETALENRKKFEADQAEAARVKAENEAKEKKLAEQQAKIDAEEKRKANIQAAIDRLRDEIHLVVPEGVTSSQLSDHVLFLQRYPADKDIYQDRFSEAEQMIKDGIVLYENRLETTLDREKLEAEKTKMAEEQYQRDWDEALSINLEMIHDRALVEHTRYKAELQTEIDYYRAEAKARWEATQQAQAEAAARAKLVEPDQRAIKSIACVLGNIISEAVIPIMNTKEANVLTRDLVADLKNRIHEFEQAGAALK